MNFVLVSRWFACIPLLPVVAFQGARLRERIVKLPEASGVRVGQIAGEGRPLRLAIIGESTAAGVGVETHGDGVAGRLAHHLHQASGRAVEWQVLGRTGLTMATLRALLAATEPANIDLAIVLCGVNDVVRLTSIREWRRSVVALLETLRTSGVHRAVFSSIPPVGAFSALPRPLANVLGIRARLLDDQLAHVLAGRLDASYCPISFSTEPHCAAIDGFHPSASGYEVWAQQISRYLLENRMHLPGSFANDGCVQSALE